MQFEMFSKAMHAYFIKNIMSRDVFLNQKNKLLFIHLYFLFLFYFLHFLTIFEIKVVYDFFFYSILGLSRHLIVKSGF